MWLAASEYLNTSVSAASGGSLWLMSVSNFTISLGMRCSMFTLIKWQWTIITLYYSFRRMTKYFFIVNKRNTNTMKPQPLQYSHAFTTFISKWCIKPQKQRGGASPFCILENVPHNSMINCSFFSVEVVPRCCGYFAFSRYKKTKHKELLMAFALPCKLWVVDWKNSNENKSTFRA